MSAKEITSINLQVQKVTDMQFRRNRPTDATASPRTRHNGTTPDGPVRSPQPPHAATVTATDAFAGQYRYDAATLTGLYAKGRDLLAKADANERRANDLFAEADGLLSTVAHQRAQAADAFRLLRLAELDAVTPEGAAWPVPAPQLPQKAAPVVHFSDNVSFWPPCGARTEATWATVNEAEVTCSACREHLDSRAQPPGDPWSAPLPPSRDGDTERLPKIEVAR